ncbi:MAG: roadblock/LC7 domain-containing protein, partial [Clostridia bacterium]
SLGPHDLARLDQLLRSFLDETKAHCVLLLDRTGHILTTAGDGAGLDRMAIASLAAADFAASGQLAVLLGEEEFTSLYHHGTRRSMYLVDLAGQAILAALFDGRTNHARSVLETVVREFGGDIPVFDTPIRRSIRFSESAQAGRPIFDYAPDNPGVEAYRRLAREVLRGGLAAGRRAQGSRLAEGR